MTEPVLATVSPIFTVDGVPAAALARDCVRLEIEEGVEGLRTLQADFLAVGAGATGPPKPMLHLDGTTIDFGKAIEVCLGPDADQRIVFDGAVSAIDVLFGDGEPPRVIVLAEDALMRLRMIRRMRTYRHVTDGDIAQAIAAEHGLTADVTVDGPRYDVVQQANQSDLAFLRERARLVAAELWCDGRTLHVSARPRRDGSRVTLVQGNQLISARLRADLAHQRSEVLVAGYDAGTKGVIDERAGADVVEAEITGGRTGPRVLEKALGPSTSVRVREVPLSGAEANAWARAEMLRRARRFVTVTGTTRGTPDLVVGSTVTLRLVGQPFEGDGYYVTRVRHTYDLQRGMRTRFEAERSTVNEVA